MTYEFYNVAHVIGVLFLFTSLWVLWRRPPDRPALRCEKLASIAHGVALALIFVAGFGLLARLGHFGAIPTWAYLKMAMWAVLGAGRRAAQTQTRVGAGAVGAHAGHRRYRRLARRHPAVLIRGSRLPEPRACGSDRPRDHG